MISKLVTNLLEPISYLILFFAMLRIYRQGKERKDFILMTYFGLSAVALAFASVMAFELINNNWIYNSLYIPAIAAIGYYFYQSVPRLKLKVAVFILFFINLAFFSVRNIPISKFRIFDTTGYALLSISVAILCFLYFLFMLRNVTEYHIWKNYEFWVSSVLLLYYLGAFFIFLFYNVPQNFTKANSHLLTVLWGVHNVLLFLSSIIVLCSSIWIPSRNR